MALSNWAANSQSCSQLRAPRDLLATALCTSRDSRDYMTAETTAARPFVGRSGEATTAPVFPTRFCAVVGRSRSLHVVTLRLLCSAGHYEFLSFTERTRNPVDHYILAKHLRRYRAAPSVRNDAGRSLLRPRVTSFESNAT